MSSTTYNLNTRIRVSVQFTRLSVNTDPTTVQVVLVKPNLTQQIVTGVTHDGAGAYHYDFVVDQPGRWVYRWEGSGSVIAQAEDAIAVREASA